MITGIIHDSRRVDKFTSRQVNQLLVDRVNKRQSNIGTRFLKLMSKRVNLQTRYLLQSGLSTKHLFTCYLVFSYK